MAHLVAIQTSTGEWQAFVVAHPSNRFVGDVDVTGRTIPSFRHMRAWDGVAGAEAERLALSLRGVPGAQRHAAILKASEGLRLSASAGTPVCQPRISPASFARASRDVIGRGPQWAMTSAAASEPSLPASSSDRPRATPSRKPAAY